jgi:hypothetical protein
MSQRPSRWKRAGAFVIEWACMVVLLPVMLGIWALAELADRVRREER